MKSLSIIFLVFFVSVNALPIAENDEPEGKITSNQLFHQLNEILKREIEKDTKDDSLEVGDKVKGDDGKLQLSVQTFSSFQGFPIIFNKKDKEVLDDKVIVPIVADFKGSSEYEIKKESSEEASDAVATKKPKTDEKAPTTTEKSVKASSAEKQETSTQKVTESSTSTTNKHGKLLKDIAEEPVILTQH